MSDVKSTDNLSAFIYEFPMFEKIRPKELSEIFHIIERVKYDAGQVIFEEGDYGDAFYIVYKGMVDVFKGGNKIAVIGQNESFGEMAILEDMPRSATIVTSKASVLLRISKKDFEDLISQDHPAAFKLSYEMAKMLASRTRIRSEWLTDLLREDHMKYAQTELTGLVNHFSINE